MTQAAFDLARRASVGEALSDKPLRWLAHGRYQFKGLDAPIDVYEVGAEGVAPLAPPANSDKATRVAPGDHATDPPVGAAPAPGGIAKSAAVDKAAPSGVAPLWRRMGLPALAVAAIAAVLLVAWHGWFGAPPNAAAGLGPGIAVLPFANLSADANQGYVADGMTDAIIAELGRIRSLRVISRQSVMRYKATTEPVPRIAADLGVGAVITGSVTRTADQLRVRVALVRASPERELWSQTYDRGVGDMVTLSGEVAQAIVRHVQAAVTPQEQAQLAKARPVNAGVQQALLLGRYFWNKRDKPDIDRAIEEFKRAIALDPNEALGYAGLADCFVVAWDNGYLPPTDAYREAKSNAMKALQLDDTIAEAHASLGAVYSAGALWLPAEQEFRRALELNPGYVTAHDWLALNLSTRGRHAEAVAEAKRALELDPVSPLQHVLLARRLYYAGDYPAASAQLKKALDLDPRSAFGYDLLGLVDIAEGHDDAAVKALEEVTTLTGEVQGNLGYAYAVAGHTAAAAGVLEQLLAAPTKDPMDIAYVYLGLGKRDQAIEWFTKAYQASEGVAQDLAINPRLMPISTDPRFLALLQKSGLTYSPGRLRP